MTELKAIARAAETLRQKAEPFVLATVVRVRGSAYRRPGARMLVTRDRWVAGSVSGGCAERDVLERGFWHTMGGAPRLVTYDSRPDDDDAPTHFGVGCDGAIDVLLEPETQSVQDSISFISRCCERQERGALATVFGGDEKLGARLALYEDGAAIASELDDVTRESLLEECRRVLATRRTSVVRCRSASGVLDALVEAVRPPPRLFVVDAGHDAVPVVTLARTVGWETTVCERSTRFVTRERFAHADEIVAGRPLDIAERVAECDRALAVVMAHDYERDRACLSALLETGVVYIGMLGPRRRTARMLEELGVTVGDLRVHAPVGLALGAESPEEIALSIIAEAQAALTGAHAAPLSSGGGTIHAAAGN